MIRLGPEHRSGTTSVDLGVRLRRLARRLLPFELRLLVARLRRSYRDRRAGFRFATQDIGRAAFQHGFGAYRRPFIDYPGQGALASAKRHNQEVMARALDGVVVPPGAVFSLWRLAGRPTASAGYERAAAIRGDVLTSDIGGATCLLSTVLYNTALLGGQEIVERHCHSADTYGEARYFELGRDAAIEYGWSDLRFRNSLPVPVQVRVRVSDAAVETELFTETPIPVSCEIEVREAFRTSSELCVRTRRAVSVNGVQSSIEDLGESRYIRWTAGREA